MRSVVFLAVLFLLSGCATRVPVENIPRGPVSAKSSPTEIRQLQAALGMNRPAQDLGLKEKMFDSCRANYKDGSKCGIRYMSVVNFRLSCRDSEGTTEQVVVNIRPLVNDRIEYQLAGSRGILKSDSQGFAQLQVVTVNSIQGERLVVTVGKQFFGKDVSDIDQVVLPRYWCE